MKPSPKEEDKRRKMVGSSAGARASPDHIEPPTPGISQTDPISASSPFRTISPTQPFLTQQNGGSSSTQPAQTSPFAGIFPGNHFKIHSQSPSPKKDAISASKLSDLTQSIEVSQNEHGEFLALMAKFEADAIARRQAQQLEDEKRRAEDDKRRAEEDQRRRAEEEQRRIANEQHEAKLREELHQMAERLGCKPLGIRQPNFDSPIGTGQKAIPGAGQPLEHRGR